MRKLPARYGTLVMPLLLSIFMTCIISFISTMRSVGTGPQLLQNWPGAWLISWLISFPTLLVMLPIVRKLTLFLVEPPPPPRS